MTDMTVAKTILEQLGGQRFVRFTGAKNLIGGENSLTLSIVGKIAEGLVNRVKITLEPSDTYKVESFYVRAPNVTSRKVMTHIYCDMLQEVFLEVTGLYTSFNQ